MTATVASLDERRQRKTPAWNPDTRKHSWSDIDEGGDHHECQFCRVRYHSEPDGSGGFLKVWSHGARSGRSRSLGRCPGPEAQPALTVVADPPAEAPAMPAARLAPLDRRAPVPVAAGRCPMGESCGCCPGAEGVGHRRGRCRLQHPAQDRKCRLPYPSVIPPCPERKTLPQTGPGAGSALCIECGLVTGRRWLADPAGKCPPWCGGQIPGERVEVPA